eukprot:8743258-Alexandrium_andersonii.AAC.1
MPALRPPPPGPLRLERGVQGALQPLRRQVWRVGQRTLNPLRRQQTQQHRSSPPSRLRVWRLGQRTLRPLTLKGRPAKGARAEGILRRSAALASEGAGSVRALRGEPL